MFENKELGTYPDEDILVETYTTGVSNKALYDLLGYSNLDDYSFDYYVDGVVNTDATADTILSRTTNDFGASDDGVLTQVFVDHEANNGRGAIIITSIHTWLAQAAADYNTSRKTVSLRIFTSHDEGTGSSDGKTNSTSETVDVDDVAAIADLKKDDFVLVHRSGTSQSNNKLVVVDVVDPEIIPLPLSPSTARATRPRSTATATRLCSRASPPTAPSTTAPPWPTTTPAP